MARHGLSAAPSTVLRQSINLRYHLPLKTLTRATNAPALSLRLPSLTLRKRMPLCGAVNSVAFPTKTKSSLSSPTTAIKAPVGRAAISLRPSERDRPSGPARWLSPRSTSPVALITIRCPFWTRISVLVQSAAPATLTVFSAIAGRALAPESFGGGSGSAAVLGSSLGAAVSMGRDADVLSRGGSAREGAVTDGVTGSA